MKLPPPIRRRLGRGGRLDCQGRIQQVTNRPWPLSGFHRIRYYGLFASTTRADNIARARELLAVPMLPIEAINAASTDANEPQTPEHLCPCCGGRMIIIETFERGRAPRYRPTAPTVAIRIDTS